MAKIDYDKLYRELTTYSINSFKQDNSSISEYADIFNEGFIASYKRETLDNFKHKYILMYWFRTYPKLFDRDDLWLASRDQKEVGNHFGEWLGAILFYHHFGYISLIEKYEKVKSKAHRRKGKVFQSLVDPSLHSYVASHSSQPPDLFLFKHNDQMFCEIKRKKNNESLTPNQPKHFNKLFTEHNKKVALLTLNEE
jgi:hypothetical protein